VPSSTACDKNVGGISGNVRVASPPPPRVSGHYFLPAFTVNEQVRGLLDLDDLEYTAASRLQFGLPHRAHSARRTLDRLRTTCVVLLL